MSGTNLFYLLIVIWVIINQLRPKEIDMNSKGKYVLFFIGLYTFYNSVQSGDFIFTPFSTIGLVFVLLFLAVGLAFLRAYTSRVWKEGGILYSQGTWKTVVIWIVMIVFHAITDHFIKGLNATFLLYIGISLITQHWYKVSRLQSY
ncbi:hypothetical protein IGJ91_002225 [Enterococcus sp. DIV0765f]|uniref:hypothetical protein n=1 Tax=Enterococcus TaxID=1350 RepID=UPI001FB9F56F|nr:hypothetical protein [Enterococcus mundtii]GKS55454.1 hypothetical protein EMLAB_20690 [Enterococcus mundtii]